MPVTVAADLAGLDGIGGAQAIRGLRGFVGDGWGLKIAKVRSIAARMSQRISFWDAVFSDVSAVERRAFDSVADSIDGLGRGQFHLESRVDELTKRLGAQQKVIEQLRAVLHVVVDALGEDRVSAAVLDARIEAALDALNPPPPAPVVHEAAGGGPYRDGPVAAVPAAPVKQVACARCTDWFAENRMNIVADGLICDRCFHR